jgi:hypothetical protein
MIRSLILPAVLLALLLAACGGEHCEPVPISYCAEYEQPDTLVMNGWWSGEYDVSFHYLIFSNSLSMTWHEGSYQTRVQRDGFWREPFYRTASFSGEGPLAKAQQQFHAQYSPWENWTFTGNYTASQQEMRFAGRVFVEGKDRGNFHMTRPRFCVRKAEYEKHVCAGGYYPPVTNPAETSLFQLVSATVAPNPVTAGTALTIAGMVIPEGEHVWTVSMSPATAPAQVTSWSHTGATFSETVTAPSEAGAYAVSFRITRDIDAQETIGVDLALTVEEASE